MTKPKPKHVRTPETRKIVRTMRSEGKKRKEIAKVLGISCEALKRTYKMALKRGDMMLAKKARILETRQHAKNLDHLRKLRQEIRQEFDPAKAEEKLSKIQNVGGKSNVVSIHSARNKTSAVSRFTHSNRPPPNCPIPEEDLMRHLHRIVKYDENGMPCDSRGNQVFSKKMMDEVMGKAGFKGTRWEVVETCTPGYASLKISTTPWTLGCTDWEKRIMGSKNLLPFELPKSLTYGGFWDDEDMGDSLAKKAVERLGKSNSFNIELAQRALIAFGWLKLADAEGTPMMDDAGAHWFKELVAVIFGSYDPATKSRMIREVFLLVPKKNNKTTGGALIMLLLLIFNKRPRGKAIMVAPLKDVAAIAFEAIAGAIALDDELSRVFTVKGYKRTIEDGRTKATLRVLTFDPKQLTGQKVFAALIDELHVIAKMSKADSSIRQIRGGMLPFPEAILIFITTQSEDAPVGVFKSELQKARDIRDGKITNSRMLPLLYEFPRAVQESKSEDWKNPKLWPKVTPNAGRSIGLSDLEILFDEAASKGIKELKLWASQHLNIEIGMALRSDSWAGADQYEKIARDPNLTVDELLKKSEVVIVGIDGGGLDDFLAVNVMGREKGTGKWLSWVHAWAHPILIDRNKNEATRFEDFKQMGELTIVDEMGDDIDELISIVLKVHKANLLHKIGLDPHGVGSIMEALVEAKIPEDSFMGISQGWRMSGAILTMEREMATGRFVPSDQKIMAWAVSNAKVERRSNAIIITKEASGSAKIDPLMATLNSLHIMSSNPPAKSKSYQIMVLGGTPNLGITNAQTRN